MSPRGAFLFHRTHFPMKQNTAPTVFIHDNRMLAERAFYCFTGFSGTITKAAGSGQRQRPDE